MNKIQLKYPNLLNFMKLSLSVNDKNESNENKLLKNSIKIKNIII